MKYHKGHYKLPKWIRWAFFSCRDCGVKLRNARSGRGFGVPHYTFTVPSDEDKYKRTSYCCLDCEMDYDED